MSQWSTSFDTVLTSLEKEQVAGLVVHSSLHSFLESWKHENDCLVWVTEVPGANVFGSTVIFVNNKVISKLGWTFAEWEDGTASDGVFDVEEDARIQLYLTAKSTLPTLARVRKKTTPVGVEGDAYVMYFVHDLPHGLRMTVGVPG